MWFPVAMAKRLPKPLLLRLNLFNNHLIQGHQRARFGRLEFRDLADRISCKFGQPTSSFTIGSWALAN